MSARTLTSVPGVRVGHATAPDRSSGCTVVLGPMRAAAEVRGMATGGRELGTLQPDHLVPAVDAILLTGGSAFGLAAADGVAEWLEARGCGYDTGVARVPIVPAAVIFDLAPGSARPDAAMGRAACDGASAGPVAEGRVGAGAGATVGKVAGPEAAMPGGVGTFALDAGSYTVGALAVVNALGDVVDAAGRIVAGARAQDGGFLDATALLRAWNGDAGEMADQVAGRNTTLAVVATDAPLTRVDLGRLARQAANALARRIRPVHTPFDGDVVFAVSTAGEAKAASSREILALGWTATAALEEAVTRAVVEGVR